MVQGGRAFINRGSTGNVKEFGLRAPKGVRLALIFGV